MKTKILLGTFAIILGLATGIYFFRPHTFHGTVIQSPETSYDFTLTGGNGDVSLSDFRGKLVLIYFGYTFCPDICPATLGNVNQALKQIGAKAEDIQLIMVSLDPQRDTPEKLEQYVAHFNPTFIGITGTQEQVDTVTSLYGIFYEKKEGSEATSYLIDHTATLMVIDREGYLKLVFPFGVTADEIADDLKYMLRQ
ncbi:MAG: SCO family protein [Anaerolineales bacterium]|uniref:SCO family protein n=1 Tax=Candidatus Villigracilis affinis TaxID=3140682 RepID=UPI001D3BD123|nr:SCO family protein [Anaerolineales bacterium]MBK9603188.1 SCO family protein [Anaerolineales bacterium]